VEDTVAAAFAFEGGALGSGLWSFASDRREDRVEILGSAGSIRFATFADEPLRLENASGIAEADIPNPPHVQQPLIQTVVDALRGEGVCPSTGESAARTSKVMDAILADYSAAH
jgi:predicted dehydrogenase